MLIIFLIIIFVLQSSRNWGDMLIPYWPIGTLLILDHLMSSCSSFKTLVKKHNFCEGFLDHHVPTLLLSTFLLGKLIPPCLYVSPCYLLLKIEQIEYNFNLNQRDLIKYQMKFSINPVSAKNIFRTLRYVEYVVIIILYSYRI